jgi:hypothetical protein
MPTALVTGASAGLGAEFARQLAASGHDLVLVARDSARLDERRTELVEHFGVEVEALPADLTTDAGCSAVVDRLSDSQHAIDVLVNNAGAGTYQPFGGVDIDREERQLDLNVRSVLRLSHAAVRTMTGRKSGRVINVSSVSAFVPRTTNASYNASKAWVSWFSQGLAEQLRGTGVTVTVICPGFTRTEFHQRADADLSGLPERMWLSAEDVVREGLADAWRGVALSVPTRRYRRMVARALIARGVLAAARWVPGRVARRLATPRELR